MGMDRIVPMNSGRSGWGAGDLRRRQLESSVAGSRSPPALAEQNEAGSVSTEAYARSSSNHAGFGSATEFDAG